MRTLLGYTLKALLVIVVVAAGVAFWKRAEIRRLMTVNSLFSAEKIVHNFSHMDAAFLTKPVDRGTGPVSPLPAGTPVALPAEVDKWIADRHVTSLVVVKDGKIVDERYFLGTKPEDRRISWSMAKSFLSALFGIVMAEGAIDSLDDPVVKYAPLLKGSAYDGATIRNVLNMASGVAFNEDYLDYYSDINRMGRELALGGSMDKFAAALNEHFAKPGTVWQYVSIDTHVIGMVIRGATGRTIPDLMSEKVIAPLGLEESPYYLTDGQGVAFVLGGLNMRTRDYARFGLMFLNDGFYNGRQIVPKDWVRASTVATAPTAPGEFGYGYQWWVPSGAPEGEFLARGIYGQYIYVNRPEGVVIASNAADRLFREPGVDQQNVDIFRLIAQTVSSCDCATQPGG